MSVLGDYPENPGGTSAGLLGGEDAARQAVAVVFILNGFALASWVARLPELRDRLGLSPGQLGLLLLCVSAGTLLALPSSGLVITRLGVARTVQAGAVLVGLGMLLMVGGLVAAHVLVVAVAFFAYGLGTSSWDVAMNVEAADVERRLGRSIMPRFHAGFSVGTVLGALAGTACAQLGVALSAQLAGSVVVVVLVPFVAVRRFLPLTHSSSGHPGSPWRAWRELRTLAIGLVVLAFALCEGIANDWLALALVDGYQAAAAVGSAGFAVFVTAMTVGRFVGGSVTDRFGRVTALRATAVLVVAGVAAVVLSPGVIGAFLGAVLWGLGASLGFPTGMTAAGEDERHAAVRLSVVSSIGYAAFLGGPPLVGALADQVGVRNAIWVAAGAAAVGLLASPAVAPQLLTRRGR